MLVNSYLPFKISAKLGASTTSTVNVAVNAGLTLEVKVITYVPTSDATNS